MRNNNYSIQQHPQQLAFIYIIIAILLQICTGKCIIVKLPIDDPLNTLPEYNAYFERVTKPEYNERLQRESSTLATAAKETNPLKSKIKSSSHLPLFAISIDRQAAANSKEFVNDNKKMLEEVDQGRAILCNFSEDTLKNSPGQSVFYFMLPLINK